MSDTKLTDDCNAIFQSAKGAIDWINDEKNAEKIVIQKAALERSLRRVAFEAGKLKQTADWPMCVGVFGPSQCGKSYLISYLARKNDTLTACFEDKFVNFVQDINPDGGKESTGLVTRFTIQPIATPRGFPVALRLLSQTDIVKIIVNSYCNEGHGEFEDYPQSEAIQKTIASLSQEAKGYTDGLREEDIWDLQEYFLKFLRRFDWTKRFEPFWERVATLAPKLHQEKRAQLFSLLWGQHEPLTSLYLHLLQSLAALDHATDAFCELEAITPKKNSILDVDTLTGLDQKDGMTIQVSTGMKTVTLSRSTVAALTAELRIRSKERAKDFFEYTDLLDFPGYRSREPLNLKVMFRDSRSKTIKDMFTRGKVDYLFQRYTADQELTSMLLCLKDSNLDVTSLPAVIEDWTKLNHGETPEQREGRSILLFFVLTWFDVHLMEKAGDQTDKGGRFKTRLEASLLKPFAKTPDAWPLQWTSGKPFKNCFWIRNPNVKSEGVIEYEGYNEIRILPKKEQEISALRESYGMVEEVKQHFAEPLRAWDEVMRLNDGGVSYLAENLAKVCLPDTKVKQVRARLSVLRQQVHESLRPLYVPDDIDQREKERMAKFKEVLIDLDSGPRAKRRFGSLVRALCVERALLSDALFAARATADEEDKGSVLDEFEFQLSAAESVDQSRFSKLGIAAVQAWTKSMATAREDELFAGSVGVKSETMSEVIREIEGAATRLKLSHVLARRMEKIIHLERPEQIVAKATILCERSINQFVSTIGYCDVPLEKRPTMPRKDAPPVPIFSPPKEVYDASSLGAQSSQFARQYFIDWCKALQETFRDNARTVDGSMHDPVQNRRLGEILKGLNGSQAIVN